MKKKILGGVAALAIAAVVAFNISLNTKKDNVSLLVLANVEALAGNEGSGNSNAACLIVEERIQRDIYGNLLAMIIDYDCNPLAKTGVCGHGSYVYLGGSIYDSITVAYCNS